jgi:8-oxo-dGTP pyrophosphatase MutT (NUDIX family)
MDWALIELSFSLGHLQREEIRMKATRRREIACAVILDVDGRILLQQRDNIAGILHPGKVALFGGHREGSETFLDCVVREVEEEISKFIPAERFEYLISLIGDDLDSEGATVHAEFFVIRDLTLDGLFVTEGSLLVIEPRRVFEIVDRLTPSARYAMKAFGVPGL